jgi:amino acid transporter
MKAAEPARNEPKRQLSLFDSACIIVGIIIGSGIYETSPLIAKQTPNSTALIACWVLGGVIALIGSLCYAELATAYPVEGGDYVYLTEAYGRSWGFLFVWCKFWIVGPGNVGLMAFVFARYAAKLYPLGAYERTIYASGAVAVLTLVNILGVRTGKWTQNILTSAKVGGLVCVVVVTFLVLPRAEAPATDATASVANVNFLTAMVLIIFTYGGWNEMAFVAAEVRDPRTNMVRSLLLGAGLVTVIYVLMNLAFLHGLGFPQLQRSDAVAANLLAKSWGEIGSTAISLLVCISCLGAINGMLFTASRIYYAVGVHLRAFSWLGKWNAKFDAPVRTLLVQGVVVLGMVVGFGLYANGFERLVLFTSIFFYFFFLLVAVSLFVLRVQRPSLERPFRVPLFPLTPALFCLACLFMLYATIDYIVHEISRDGFYNEGYWGIAVLATGLVFCLASAKS